jgi:RNase adaptor protein for sRNA GlmZ degradation
MSAEVIVIAGLPGSGKTTHMDALRQEGWLIFDDFKANAYNDSSIFTHSRNYESLLGALRAGKRCLIADIDFCKATSRHEAETAIRAQIPDVNLSYIFFENDLHACQANLVKRASRSLEENLKALHRYHGLYEIPADARVIPVWRPDA